MLAAKILTPEKPEPDDAPRILIVEDDGRVARYLQKSLQRAGYVIQVRTTGSDAMASLNKQPLPNLILSDLVMPGMSGMELLQRVRESPATSHLPFVLLSGSDAPVARVESLEAGANDYISKPIEPAELVARVRLHLRHSGELRRLREEARVDELTGISNRRGVTEALSRELHRVSRDGTPIAVLLADVDKFKLINDTYGHLVGDRVLCCIADTLSACVRTTDVVGRLGGDEFVLILPGVDTALARTIGQRAREAIAALVVPGTKQNLATSIGIVVDREHTASPMELLDRADYQMYRDKQRRRNTHVVTEVESANAAQE